MDDWNGQLNEMAQRLDEWNAVYEREYARLSKMRRGWFRTLGEAEVEMIGREARAAAGADLLDEFSAFLDELCDHYVDEPLAQERAKIRKRVGEEPALLHFLWSYVTRGPVLVRAKEDAPAFRRALAAASIDDGRVDLEQLDFALGGLWLAAARAGIDPRPVFHEVAQASNPGQGGGGATTKRLLEGFDRSLHFEREIRPQLPRASA